MAQQSLEQARDELMRTSRDILKRKCRKLKVSAEGSKSDMIERIIQKMYGENNIIPPPSNPSPQIQINDNDRELKRLRALQRRRLQYQPSVPIKRVVIIKEKKHKTTKINTNKSVKKAKLQKRVKPNYLTFQFVGIRSLNNYKQTKFENIKLYPMIVPSKLLPKSSIGQLKQFIKKIYCIPVTHDILILFSNVKISNNNDAKLKHFGVTNFSLLCLAISVSKIKSIYDPYTHHRVFNSLKQTRESMKNDVKRGMDIITQQDDVNIFKMPCGHRMARASLYYYAINSFMNRSNVYLTCPHTINDEKEEKYNHKLQKWSCPNCTFYNNTIRNPITCRLCNARKPVNVSFSTNQCNQIWHYSLIKQILHCHDDEKLFTDDNIAKLELLASRNRLENDYINDKKLDLQKCYNCKTLHYKHPKRKKTGCTTKFKTKCILCKKYFCWTCGKQYKGSHVCDGSFQKEIIKILQLCPTKRIGSVSNVPSIRACPNENCGQMITHLTACKHIKCRSCSLSFCFICMLPQVNGNWQCGSHSSPCRVAPRQTLKSMKNHTKNIIIVKKTFQLW